MSKKLLDFNEWIICFGDSWCPGTTSRGTPCRRHVAETLVYWDDRKPWPACPRHMTPEDRAAWEAQQAEDRAQLDWVRERAEPACWSWPVPTDEDLEAYDTEMVQGFSESGRFTNDEITLVLGLLEDGQDRDLDLLDLFHDGRCAFCGKRKPGLVTDHDHGTGLIRGYLCAGCNGHEGKSHTPKLRKYRERPPTTILGIEKIYVNIYGDTPVRERLLVSTGHQTTRQVQEYQGEHVPEADNAVTRIGF